MMRLNLSGPQLYEAARQQGIERLLLPDDPFRGWLVEEIDAELEGARKQLLESGILTIQEDSAPKLEDVLEATVRTLGAPQCTVILTHVTLDRSEESLYLHKGEGGWISLRPEDGGIFEIERISSRDKLTKTTIGLLKVGKQQTASGKTSTLKAEAMTEARNLVIDQGADACAAHLKNAGLSDDNGPPLAEALAAPLASGSVAAMTWQGMESLPIGGVAFLEGPDGLWQFEMDEQAPDWVIVEPIEGKKLTKDIKSLLKAVERE